MTGLQAHVEFYCIKQLIPFFFVSLIPPSNYPSIHHFCLLMVLRHSFVHVRIIIIKTIKHIYSLFNCFYSLLQLNQLQTQENFVCIIKGRVIPLVVPKQRISPKIHTNYFSTPAPRPQGSLGYDMTSLGPTQVSGIVSNITASNNARRMLAGEELTLTVKLKIPECYTKLTMLVRLPFLSLVGTPFERQRRSVLGNYQR